MRCRDDAKKQLQLVESAQAKRNGDLNYKILVRMDGESDDEARRVGVDSTVPVIFISEMEVLLY
jgi:hypothetical protein